MATNFSGSSGARRTFRSDPIQIQPSGGYGAAAGMTDISGVYNAGMQNSPDPARIGAIDVANRSNERNAALKAQVQVGAAGISALADIRSNKMMADAQVAAAKKQAAASQSGAAMGAIGSVIGAGLSLFSDERTKRDIQELDDALQMLRELRPVSFYYKEDFTKDPNRKHHGFIAQEFKEVLPDATYQEETTGKLCIDTIDVIGLLVRSVQQLEERVMYLEAQRALAGVK